MNVVPFQDPLFCSWVPINRKDSIVQEVAPVLELEVISLIPVYSGSREVIITPGRLWRASVTFVMIGGELPVWQITEGQVLLLHLTYSFSSFTDFIRTTCGVRYCLKTWPIRKGAVCGTVTHFDEYFLTGVFSLTPMELFPWTSAHKHE